MRKAIIPVVIASSLLATAALAQRPSAPIELPGPTHAEFAEMKAGLAKTQADLAKAQADLTKFKAEYVCHKHGLGNIKSEAYKSNNGLPIVLTDTVWASYCKP